MSSLHEALDAHLAIRCALGFKLENDGRLLGEFVMFIEQSDRHRITTEHAVEWAKRPVGAKPHRWSQRLGMVRRFAQYLSTIDPDTQIPPADLLPHRQQRVTPYVYSSVEIEALMSAAARRSPPLHAATTRTVIGLLATTGMRVGEVLALDESDFDPDGGVITAMGKWAKPREVQLHRAPSTIAAYRDAMRLLLTFVAERTGKQRSRLEFDDLDAPMIGAFLDDRTGPPGSVGETARCC
jgi:integrase